MPDAAPAPAWVAATVPKRGNRADENEDALAVSPDARRFAVSDGATEGWESGPWAARLVAAYTADPPGPADFAAWLGAARTWRPPAAAGPEPWYAAEKRMQGSFATLLGVELRPSHRTAGWAWRAVAVGDTCLLQVRGTELELAVPLASPREFGNRPALVPSAPAPPEPKPAWFAGRVRPGDLLLLATDAAAAHLLSAAALPAALTAARAALAAGDPGPLADWCRAVQDAHNDDVSVIGISFPSLSEHGRPGSASR